jgi:hypothetical protein
VCSFVCCVLFERGVIFCVMCVISVLCLIVVPLPPDKNPFAVKINNNGGEGKKNFEGHRNFVMLFSLCFG